VTSRALSRWLAMAALAALAACGREPFMNTDVSGADYGKDFRLVDHNGKPRTLADFKGKVVLLFFGYTQCPDVCPTTLAEAAMAMKELGPQAERVQVLFVTLDPARDTPEILARYVPSFNPTFLGLHGDATATATTAKDFKVFWQRVQGSTPEHYLIDHAAGTFVFDPQGRRRLYHGYGKGTASLVHDARLLLDGA
jgi:protein SCO1/2